jgi:hypothetical protein
VSVLPPSHLIVHAVVPPHTTVQPVLPWQSAVQPPLGQRISHVLLPVHMVVDSRIFSENAYVLDPDPERVLAHVDRVLRLLPASAPRSRRSAPTWSACFPCSPADWNEQPNTIVFGRRPGATGGSARDNPGAAWIECAPVRRGSLQ